ncbi:histidine kinase [Sphingobacteriaceae bacterium]|nr:histidine kinase [Sphingobacteriaceae bacterium]
MKVASYLFQNNQLGKIQSSSVMRQDECQLLLGFGGKKNLSSETLYSELRKQFPNAQIALASTAGEIIDSEVKDDSLVLTAVAFEKTHLQTAMVNSADFTSSFEAGKNLVSKLDKKALRYIFILSDGATVNGSELVRGIDEVNPDKIPVTGGLAGDGENFNSTLVGLNCQPAKGNILAIGFYGDALRISHGSKGGWDIFGLEKTITKSSANKLFEIDHKNALGIYKKYLGKYAEGLPGSALLFPLSVKLPGSEAEVVRTILSIDKEEESMVFAGDVPEGTRVRFMKADFERLIDAASGAAQSTFSFSDNAHPKLAILISCVGRKIILDKRVEEEVEAVRDTLGKDVVTTGFYSYGEISPLSSGTKCELHNQTMTITTFDEI